MTRTVFIHWSQIQRKIVGLTDHLLEQHQTGGWVPNTDICEGPDDMIVKMELAGVAQDSIHINLENQALLVEGVRRDPYGRASTADYRFRQMEIEYGPFRRVVQAPFPVDGARAKAVFENGILKITVPRARPGKQTTINVDGES
jgi:HSP20 family protein